MVREGVIGTSGGGRVRMWLVPPEHDWLSSYGE